MSQLAVHWKILIGMLLGLLLGYVAVQFSAGPQLIKDWVKPFGTIFINLLKLIAVPLVFVSLAKGIIDLKDLTALSRIGGRTIMFFIGTTVFAVLVGLILVTLFKPGTHVQPDTVAALTADYTSSAAAKVTIQEEQSASGPLDFFVQLVPENIVEAAGANTNMLQIIFFAVFFSICLLLLSDERQEPVKKLLDSLNDVLIKMVELIMKYAPYAVLALMASLFIDSTSPDLFYALISYALILVFGMILLLLAYIGMIGIYTNMPVMHYVKGIFPAQLVALTTSSSMATLPITMEVVEENLGVDKDITSFVCPVGATVNMDATSLMQAIAAVFLCQVFGHELQFVDYLTIVFTASMASIGAAGAPSAGIVMLIMVLESIGFPSEHLAISLAMILAVDRPLDMGRTVVNISGDSCVSVLVARSLKRKIGQRL